jgi:SAM-dependent methyltransferase
MNKPTSDLRPIENLVMKNMALYSVMESMRMGLFDALENKPASAAQVADMFDFQERPMEALLDLLAANGFLTNGSGVYANTPTSSEYLVKDSPFYQGKAMELDNRFSTHVINGFTMLLRGETAARQRTDDDWGSLDMMQGTLQHALRGALQDTVEFITGLPGFQDLRTMCDIGGNHGEFSMALMDSNTQLQGTIFDLPGVVEESGKRISERGFADRLKAVPCDLRDESLPDNQYDLVLTSHVLYAFVHDLQRVIGMIHDSLKSGGWFVSQHLDPDASVPFEQKCSREFCTRMAGYSTHFISRELLQESLRHAGFKKIITGASGHDQSGLIMAALKA